MKSPIARTRAKREAAQATVTASAAYEAEAAKSTPDPNRLQQLHNAIGVAKAKQTLLENAKA